MRHARHYLKLLFYLSPVLLHVHASARKLANDMALTPSYSPKRLLEVLAPPSHWHPLPTHTRQQNRLELRFSKLR